MRERVYRWGTKGGLSGEGEGRHREDLVLLSADDAAGRLGVDRAAVWRWCREGRITCLKIGRLWRVRTESLEALPEEADGPGAPVPGVGPSPRTGEVRRTTPSTHSGE